MFPPSSIISPSSTLVKAFKELNPLLIKDYKSPFETSSSPDLNDVPLNPVYAVEDLRSSYQKIPPESCFNDLTDTVYERLYNLVLNSCFREPTLMHQMASKVLTLMILKVNKHNITYLHSLIINIFANKFPIKTTTRDIKDYMLETFPNIIRFEKEYKYKKRCRTFKINSEFLDREDVQEAIKESLIEEAKYLLNSNTTKETLNYLSTFTLRENSCLVEGGDILVNFKLCADYQKVNPDIEMGKALRYFLSNGVKTNREGWLKIKVTYVQHEMLGRLYVIGGGLQTIPDWIKTIAFSDKIGEKPDIYNLDIKNCHPSIVLLLAKSFGIVNETVENLLRGVFPLSFTGNEKIFKLCIIATLNGAYIDKQGDLNRRRGCRNAINDLIKDETVENQLIIKKCLLYIKELKQSLSLNLGIKAKHLWKVLQREEQKVIQNLTALLAEYNFNYINMHDGLIIQDRNKYDESGLMSRFTNVALNNNLVIIEKPLKSK